MPYVITTHGPWVTSTTSDGAEHSSRPTTSRAVDTVGDANAAIRLICDPTGGRAVWTDPAIYWRSITDGGRITLPDGTVIDVERASLGELNTATPEAERDNPTRCPWPERTRRVIAAYNVSRGIYADEEETIPCP